MTIRSRITIWFIIIILIANAFLFLFNVRHIGNVLIQEVQTRVRLDLNSARRVYNGRIKEIEKYLSTACIHHSIQTLLQQKDPVQLSDLLHTMQAEGQIEILSLLTPEGTVLYRAHSPSQGDSLVGNPLVDLAIQDRKPVSGTFLIASESLRHEGEAIAQRARFPIVFTPGQRPVPHPEEPTGMAIGAAVPLFSPSDPSQCIGLLYGAILLNQRYDFVDEIRDDVFLNQTYESKSIGMATIFQGDLRIATNVLNEDGSRAVGTRMSEEVYNQVIQNETNWTNRAFVVNDWYITAYEPIRDPYGKTIGALFVGLLEEPYQRPSEVLVIGFLMMVILTTVATLFLLYFSTRLILRPIGKIISMSHQVIEGDLSARVDIRPPGEMGELCHAIDQMADAVSQREEQLKDTARQQIGQSEKLAAIGRLAAGIAHEINNPLTGVLTFAHLLRDKKNMTPEDKEDLDVVIRETTRVREIVRGLLDFARESVSEKGSLPLNAAIDQTIKLLQNQNEFRHIVIDLHLQDSLPPIYGDRNQMQQVLLNLCLNACEAMPEKGTLSLTTTSSEKHVTLQVTDTGQGIKKEHVPKIFDPFFTTKPVGKGTGLGLSVTYGIVQSHQGSITVHSEEDQGTTFTLTFPLFDPLRSANSEQPDTGAC